MAAASTGFTKPKLCFLIASLIFIPLAKAYLLMPVVILYAKMVPHSIEGLMIGLIQVDCCVQYGDTYALGWYCSTLSTRILTSTLIMACLGL